MRSEDEPEWFRMDDSSLVSLRKMRDLASDDIPEEKATTGKVTKAWWTGLFGIFENMMEAGEIESSLVPDVNAFMEDFRLRQFGPLNARKPITAEEIQSANMMINRVLGEEPKQ